MGSPHRALSLLAALLLAGCAAGPEVVVPTTPPPRADRPIYELGEKWIRSDGVYDLVRVEQDRYVFAGEHGRTVQLSKDLFVMTWGGQTFATDWEFEPPPRLPWPLQVGARGTASGFWRRLETIVIPAWRPMDFPLFTRICNEVRVHAA